LHASEQPPSNKTPEWKAGAIVIAWILASMVAVTLLVTGASRLMWGKLGPLHLAASDGDVAKCERLVKGGVPVDATDDDGDTALDWAVFYCKIDVVRKLVELGADVNHADRRGSFTPLMYTATKLRGHLLRGTQEERNEIARILIQHGADVNHAMGYGNTSGDRQTTLHFAAVAKNAGLVRMLLAAGANRDAKDTHGWRPLDMARFPDYAPNQEVISALEGP
jgi:ankyrin repeat protein